MMLEDRRLFSAIHERIDCAYVEPTKFFTYQMLQARKTKT